MEGARKRPLSIRGDGMGTIGEAVRRRRSALRSGLTGRFLDLGLIVVVAAFLILLATRVLEHGPSFFLQILTFAIANGGSPDLTMYSFDSTTSGKLDTAAAATTGTDPTGAIAIAATH